MNGYHSRPPSSNDLLCWRDARVERSEILYWRTAAGEEVDFVVEAGRQLVPIEVKATPRPRLRDAGPLRAFRAEYGKAARAGLLLHTGSTLEWLAPDVLAVPWWRVC
jgi:predicted AAA+ superfamily ATPase